MAIPPHSFKLFLVPPPAKAKARMWHRLEVRAHMSTAVGSGLKIGSSSIVVMANNICPCTQSPLLPLLPLLPLPSFLIYGLQPVIIDKTNVQNNFWGQSNFGPANQNDANVEVNLCIDSGASDALLGWSGVTLAAGTANRS